MSALEADLERRSRERLRAQMDPIVRASEVLALVRRVSARWKALARERGYQLRHAERRLGRLQTVATRHREALEEILARPGDASMIAGRALGAVD